VNLKGRRSIKRHDGIGKGLWNIEGGKSIQNFVVGYRIEGLRPVKENKVEWKLLTFVEL
jgi:hypothetical protein